MKRVVTKVTYAMFSKRLLSTHVGRQIILRFVASNAIVALFMLASMFTVYISVAILCDLLFFHEFDFIVTSDVLELCNEIAVKFYGIIFFGFIIIKNIYSMSPWYPFLSFLSGLWMLEKLSPKGMLLWANKRKRENKPICGGSLHLGALPVLCQSSNDEIRDDLEAGRKTLVRYVGKLKTDAIHCTITATTHQQKWASELGLKHELILESLKNGYVLKAAIIFYNIAVVESAIIYIASTKFSRTGRLTSISFPGYYTGTGEDVLYADSLKSHRTSPTKRVRSE
jgi:hypothetical protein